MNVIIPPSAHCHRAGFGHRMENGLVRVAPHKLVSTDRRTDRQTDMEIAYAQLYIQTNIMCKFQRSICKNVGKGDNSATYDKYGNGNCTCRTVYYQ